MSVIIGRCRHGVIVAAAKEELTSRAELESMAASYKLERVEDIIPLGGTCGPCLAQYNANLELLNAKSMAKR